MAAVCQWLERGADPPFGCGVDGQGWMVTIVWNERTSGQSSADLKMETARNQQSRLMAIVMVRGAGVCHKLQA